jgi:NTE family protein
MPVDAPSGTRGRGPEEDVTLVLGGGHALGAYQAGAYETMHAAGVRPGRIIGSSTGAITGAIIAGNPPERRVAQLRQYWGEAAQTGAWPGPAPATGPLRQIYNAAHVALAIGLGRPSIYTPPLPGWLLASRISGRLALHDHAPLRRTLERMVDFELLNGSGAGLGVGCADVRTGEEVWLESAEGWIGPEHLLASTALMPHLPPIEISGRLLCDPGFVNNLALDRALAEPPVERGLLCFAIELFDFHGGRPASGEAAAARALEMMFASHARHHIAALRREYALRARLEPEAPSVTLVHLAYQPPAHELAARMFDFSPASIAERWAAGRQDMVRALERLEARPAGARERFTYIRAVGSAAGDARA